MSAFYVEHVAMSKFCVTVWQCPDGRISLNFLMSIKLWLNLTIDNMTITNYGMRR